MPSPNAEKNRQYQAAFRARMSEEEKKEYDKARYKRNKKRYNENSKRWAQKNPHKSQASTHQTTVRKRYPEAFEASNIVTAELSDWLKEHRGCECAYCEAQATHIDHIVPLSREGSHTWDNIQLICKNCNFGKNNLLEEEYFTYLRGIINKNKNNLDIMGN